jgi:GT2 family glycosyltransferase
VAAPLASIIVPAYNRAAVTRACLESLVVSGAAALGPEIIVADDASRDDTAELKRSFPRVRMVTNRYNVGFIRNCNRAASLATGKYLIFLNNDTIVFSGWLDWLLETAEDDARVGAVGSKVLLPDGRLSEAGLQIAPDGSGFEYGVLDDPDAPRYNYVRKVDCNGGCSLLVRADLFRAIGGFADLYAPAYMDDFDLGLAVWKRGYSCVYQPKSRIVHVNFVSHGLSQSETLYARNRPRFARRWADDLRRQPPIDPANRAIDCERAARHRHGSAPLLIVDSRSYDRDIRRALLALRASGRCVMYAPLGGILPSRRDDLQQNGIEVIYAYGRRTLEDAIFEAMPVAREIAFPGISHATRWRADERWPAHLIVANEERLHA